MEPQEVVQAFVDVFNAGDLDAAASYLSDDFQFHGSMPEPLFRLTKSTLQYEV